MLIKSLIRREKGTTVSFGDPKRPDATYVFNGKGEADHVCDVDDEAHAAMLLKQRPRVFALASDPISAPEPPEDDAGLGDMPPLEEIGDDDLEGDDDGEEASREALRAARAAYRERFGKHPGPKWGVEEIAAKLREE